MAPHHLFEETYLFSSPLGRAQVVTQMALSIAHQTVNLLVDYGSGWTDQPHSPYQNTCWECWGPFLKLFRYVLEFYSPPDLLRY